MYDDTINDPTHVWYYTDYQRAWVLLSFGRQVPEGMTYSQAATTAFRIWWESVRKIPGRAELVYHVFISSLHGIPTDVGSQKIDFGDFYNYAIEQGIDYQIEAWLDGKVPVEHILGE